jgi:hypothetical protein
MEKPLKILTKTSMESFLRAWETMDAQTFKEWLKTSKLEYDVIGTVIEN